MSLDVSQDNAEVSSLAQIRLYHYVASICGRPAADESMAPLILDEIRSSSRPGVGQRSALNP